MNFTNDSNSVRAERFKPGGKWYDTWVLKLPEKCPHMDGPNYATCQNCWDCPDMWSNYAEAFRLAAGKPLGEGWMLVIQDPYNRNSHPIMLIGGVKGKS